MQEFYPSRPSCHPHCHKERELETCNSHSHPYFENIHVVNLFVLFTVGSDGGGEHFEAGDQATPRNSQQ